MYYDTFFSQDQEQRHTHTHTHTQRERGGRTQWSYFFRRVLREVGVGVISTGSRIEDGCLLFRNCSSILSSRATRSAFRRPLEIVSPWPISRLFSSATVDASI